MKTTQKKSPIDSVDFTNLPFGKIFTEHMSIAAFDGKKWSAAKITPYGPIPFSPALSALHYGQAVFEGMKAFYSSKGVSTIFRPEAHHERINKSLERLAMPKLPKKLFMEAISMVVKKDKEWLKRAGQLYLRPFVFATDAYLGVKASETYVFAVLACPVGPYFTKPLNLKIETRYSRSTPGGVGFAKAAGNYAASMLPSMLAQKEGYDQLIWTDSQSHSFIEESGVMNIACIMNGALVTPVVSETILSGITRKSILEIAQDLGYKVEERKLSVDELLKGILDGSVAEVFGMGTAATIVRVATITHEGKKYTLADRGEMSIAAKLYAELDGIKRGTKKDTHRWVKKIG